MIELLAETATVTVAFVWMTSGVRKVDKNVRRTWRPVWVRFPLWRLIYFAWAGWEGVLGVLLVAHPNRLSVDLSIGSLLLAIPYGLSSIRATGSCGCSGTVAVDSSMRSYSLKIMILGALMAVSWTTIGDGNLDGGSISLSPVITLLPLLIVAMRRRDGLKMKGLGRTWQSI